MGMNEYREPIWDSQSHHCLTSCIFTACLLNPLHLDFRSSCLSIGSSPLPRCLYCRLLVLFPPLCNIIRQRIIGIRSPKKCLYRKENRTNLEGRRPITYSSISFNSKIKRRRSHTFQHVQAYTAQLVNVWMVDFCKKPDFGRRHRIIIRKKKLEFENSS